MGVTVFSFGRLNPPTLGHFGLVREMRSVARGLGGDAVMFLSKSHDPNRDPLPPETKRGFIERAFPGIRTEFAHTAFAAMAGLAEAGVEHAVFIVGEDRADLASALARYAPANGLRSFSVRLLERGAGAISATQVRDAVKRGDLEGFQTMVPKPDPQFAHELYEALGGAMGA